MSRLLKQLKRSRRTHSFYYLVIIMDISTSRIEKVDALVIALIGQLLSQAMMILQKKKITIVQSMLRFILSAGIAILVR